MSAGEADLTGRWFRLRQRALFRITGPDRIRFLNGQVSNDVSRALDNRLVAACLCNLKGKVEALVWIQRHGESLLLDGEIEQRESILKRLEKYRIADDCEISDETGRWEILHHFVESAPGTAGRRLHREGRDLILSSGEAPPFDPAMEIGEEELRVAQTLVPIPLPGTEITGEEFPSELGLENWAVDFHKGCYLGQEIVSRLKSSGKVRVHLRAVESAEPLQKGDPVRNAAGESGRASRNSISTEEKKHLATAFFGRVDSMGKTAANQQVIEVSEKTPNCK